MKREPTRIVLEALLGKTVGLTVTIGLGLGLLSYYGDQPWMWTALAASAPVGGLLFVLGAITVKVAVASPEGLVVRYEPLRLVAGPAFRRDELLWVSVEEDRDPEEGRSTWRVVLVLLGGGSRTLVSYRDPHEARVVAEQLRDALG